MFDNPTKISPVESTFNGFGDKFTYTFKPCSFTIFRVKADSTAAKALDIPDYEWNTTPEYIGQADQLRATAKASLASLIAKAKAVYVSGADGSEKLNESIITAVNAQNSGTIKQLNTSIENLQTALNDYIKGLMKTTNEETSKLQNPNFKTMSTAGWLGDAPSLEHNVGEFFNRTFNTYQDVTGLKQGKYLVYIQGFYRDGDQPTASAKHANGTEELNAKLYAGDSITRLRSLYDFKFTEGYNGTYVDNREQTERAFKTGVNTYANYLIAEVGKDGKLRIGLKKDVAVGVDWTCFNNLRLFYIPVSSTGIIGIKKNDEKIVEPVYNLLGQRVSENSDSPIIIRNGKKYVNK